MTCDTDVAGWRHHEKSSAGLPFIALAGVVSVLRPCLPDVRLPVACTPAPTYYQALCCFWSVSWLRVCPLGVVWVGGFALKNCLLIQCNVVV